MANLQNTWRITFHLFILVSAAVYIASSAPTTEDPPAADAKKAAEDAAKAAEDATKAAAGDAKKIAEDAAKAVTEEAKKGAEVAKDVSDKAVEKVKEVEKEVKDTAEKLKDAATSATSEKEGKTPFAPAVSGGKLIENINNGLTNLYASTREPTNEFITGMADMVLVPFGAFLTPFGMQDAPKDLFRTVVGGGQQVADTAVTFGNQFGNYASKGVKSTGNMLAPINDIQSGVTKGIGKASTTAFQIPSMFPSIGGQTSLFG